MRVGQLAIRDGLSVGAAANPDRPQDGRRTPADVRPKIISLFIAGNAAGGRERADVSPRRAAPRRAGRCVYLTGVLRSFDPANNRRGRRCAAVRPSC